MLRPIAKFQVLTTALFLVLGATILVRSALRGAPWGSYLVGALFAAYGVYRAAFILRWMREERSRQ
ncbi:MAG: hypothetical protein JSV79_13730 [Armatimonadota bacterium]|nr:MAG: hypothetical protein JSV79_13730 [Armatimonadota bacterium]